MWTTAKTEEDPRTAASPRLRAPLAHPTGVCRDASWTNDYGLLHTKFLFCLWLTIPVRLFPLPARVLLGQY